MGGDGKKSYYEESNYKFYKSETVSEGDVDIEYKGYTKYVRQSSPYGLLGFYDDKTVLDPEDDVANVKLGGNWRLPTRKEWIELGENCQYDWVTYKGVGGAKFTSKKAGYTDKWIFLPAAGYSIRPVSEGYYWSSELAAWNDAYYRYFSSSYWTMSEHSRYLGLSVRPVSE